MVGETLMSLRGLEVPGGSSAPPSDKEVETLERMGFDETGKLRLLGFLLVPGLFVALEGVLIFVTFCSCLCVNAAALGHDARAWHDWGSPF